MLEKRNEVDNIQDNCGSVTPGVLKVIVPHLEERLEAFTLGLSYSLTNDDVFTFLGQLKYLKTLQLRYYWVCHLFSLHNT